MCLPWVCRTRNARQPGFLPGEVSVAPQWRRRAAGVLVRRESPRSADAVRPRRSGPLVSGARRRGPAFRAGRREPSNRPRLWSIPRWAHCYTPRPATDHSGSFPQGRPSCRPPRSLESAAPLVDSSKGALLCAPTCDRSLGFFSAGPAFVPAAGNPRIGRASARFLDGRIAMRPDLRPIASVPREARAVDCRLDRPRRYTNSKGLRRVFEPPRGSRFDWQSTQSSA